MTAPSVLTYDAARSDVHVCVPQGRDGLVRLIDATEAILEALAGKEGTEVSLTPYALRGRLPAALRGVAGFAWRMLEEERLVCSRVEGAEFELFLQLTPQGSALMSRRSAESLTAGEVS